MAKICNGCESIKYMLFPFTAREGKICIDQEGCGIEGQTYLPIKYCPVCRGDIKNLQSEKMTKELEYSKRV
jgi:hypothetical protein